VLDHLLGQPQELLFGSGDQLGVLVQGQVRHVAVSALKVVPGYQHEIPEIS
jgi:hypothetical protein